MIPPNNMTFPAETSTQASFPNTGQNPPYNNPNPATPALGITSAFQPVPVWQTPSSINQMAWPFPGQIQQYFPSYGNATPPLGANFPFQPPTFYSTPTPLSAWPFPSQIQQNTHNYGNSPLAFRTNDAFSGIFTPPYPDNTMAPYSAMTWQDPMHYFRTGQTPSHVYPHASPAPNQPPTTEPAVPKPTISTPEKTKKSRKKTPHGKQIHWSEEQDKILMDALKHTRPNTDERGLALVNVCKKLNFSGTKCKKRFGLLLRKEGLSKDEVKIVELKTELLNKKVPHNGKLAQKNVLSNKEIAEKLEISEELLRTKWKAIKDLELDFYPEKNKAWRHSDLRKLYKFLENNQDMTLKVFENLVTKIMSVDARKILSRINELNRNRDSSEKIVIDQEVIDQYSDKRPNHKRNSFNDISNTRKPRRALTDQDDQKIKKVLETNQPITLEVFKNLATEVKGINNRRIFNRLNALKRKANIKAEISSDLKKLYGDKRAERRKNDATRPPVLKPHWTEAELKIINRPRIQGQSNTVFIKETFCLLQKEPDNLEPKKNLKACHDKFYSLRKKVNWSPEEDAQLLAVLEPANVSTDERNTALFRLTEKFRTIEDSCLNRYYELCSLKGQQEISDGNETFVANEPETTTSTTPPPSKMSLNFLVA